MPRSVADVVVARLAAAGVRAVFGVPGGGGNLDLVEAAGRAGLPFVLTSTETGAAIAATAQTEITHGPGACLTTLGPGAASATNGIASAWLDRAPVVIFTDTTPARYEHQRLEQGSLFAPIAKRSQALAAATAAREIDRAIADALTGRPGPVHVECPAGVLAAPAPDRRSSARRWPRRPSVARVALGTRTRALLARARRPLLLVGLGARDPDAASSIRALSRSRGLPALVTYKAKGVVPDADEQFAGVFTNGAVERAIVEESDLIIGLGLDPVELLPRPWPYRAPVLSFCPWRLEGRHVPFAAQHVTHVAAAARAIASALPRSEWPAGRARAAADVLRLAVDVPAPGFTAQQLVRRCAARLAATHRVTVDAGAHMFPATVLWPVADSSGLLISNGLSTMGFALPAAIGAAVLDRSKPVAVLTGDGGLLMCAGELVTAIRERLRLRVVVFNDASLSLIEIKQQQRNLAPAGVALGTVDWAAVAAGLGMRAYSAGDAAGLDRALDEAANVDGPALIDVRIDRSNYGATLKAVRG